MALEEGARTSGVQLVCVLAPRRNPIPYSASAANLPDESITHAASIAKPGVYYGYAQVYSLNDQLSDLPAEDLVVLPMVMSLGWNPFYKNQRMTAVCIACFRQSSTAQTFPFRKSTSCMSSFPTFMGAS
jgi:FAD synthase